MNDADVKAYTSPQNIPRMYKVVLSATSEEDLKQVSETLNKHKIVHHLWIEQPENYATCIATKPYKKSVVSPFLSTLKLYR
mmetsp:Transcript_4914/g.7281  ORF Transcript_4914/g.7281 Transcript_4914/m.7281 type:complete len:81 (-) Transcript_4914:412-654(-)